MNILISGSTGLVGTALCATLASEGHRVIRLVRGRSEIGPNAVAWDPVTGQIDTEKFGDINAVIHLAGEGVGNGRWTAAKKRRILESRRLGTRLLAEMTAQMNPRPAAFLSASAIGRYGSCGDEILTEKSASGSDFLADVCAEWESATQPASDAGIRVALLRIGVVLSPDGGALGKMLFPFKLGLGGPIGGGRQWMSWIGLDDTVGAICHALTETRVKGAVNLVAPNPVTNREFAQALGRALGRPAILPIPGFIIGLIFGEMGIATALSSARVSPEVLEQTGYQFLYPRLDEALAELLRK
ncbi:MAG: hypothetical protein ACI9VS_001176 [Candidatus Binatia bacterium]|jgi:uncharacterized protein (TIGR01777 family)